MRQYGQHSNDDRVSPSNRAAEAFEQIGYASERELALADLSRHSELIRQIRAALGRIEDRTFGVCQYCRKPIRPKRLMAVPWTPLCIRCQETADGQDGAVSYSADRLGRPPREESGESNTQEYQTAKEVS